MYILIHIQGGPKKNKWIEKFNLEKSFPSLVFILGTVDGDHTGLLWSKDDLKRISQSRVRY